MIIIMGYEPYEIMEKVIEYSLKEELKVAEGSDPR